MYRLSLMFMLLCMLLAAPSFAVDFRAALTPTYKQGELIVRYKDDTKGAKSLQAAKASSLHSFKRVKAHHIRLPEGTTVASALKQFRADPNVLYAEPNYRVRKLQVPNDTLYSSQWGLTRISAPAAWDSYTGPTLVANSLVVAVLDTGIAYTHPDLSGNIWTNPGEICGNAIDDDSNGIVDDCYGANFGGHSPGNPWDDDTADSHGTHLAGIIGAVGNNNYVVAGINWRVRLMAVKFLHGPDGIGDLSDALQGVEYALAKGAKIINMSFEVDGDDTPQSLHEALNSANKAGVLVVSAAGNASKDLDSSSVFPASIRLDNNIAVAASTNTDGLAYYSNYGRHTVELAAPGGLNTGSQNAILSTVWLDSGNTLYRTTAGTSMAAPMVTGAAALIWNANPTLSAYQVKARILNNVDQLTAFSANTISGGRLNLAKAVGAGNIPAIFSVSPYQVSYAGGVITINGVNFGSSPGSVSLGSQTLAVTTWSDSSITATVPVGAASGTLYVNSSGVGFPLSVTPAITLTATPASGVAPLTVAFSATITTGATITSYAWDFGDGSTSTTSSSASHTYSSDGTYTARLTVTDSTGQTGTGTVTVTVAPPSGGGSGGGGCFIATAAWGSYLHPKVALLRAFRDQHLLTNGPGRLFVKAYYAVSPPLADYIARHESLRSITRWALTPLVWAVEAPLLTGGIGLILTLCMLGIVGAVRNRATAG